MGSLLSAIDEMRAEDLARVTDDALASDLDDLERASRALEAERARRVAEFERRGAFAADGYLSLAAWLAHRLRSSRAAAEGVVRRARSLASMPATEDAFAAGEVSACTVRELVFARETCPEAFERSEAALVESAIALSFPAFRRAIAYWRDAADPDRSVEEEERKYERRRLHVSPTFDGMVRVDGDLDPETGQALITAIRAVIDDEVRTSDVPDLRSPGQRRADALGEVCRQWLGSLDRPIVAGERPHVVVTVDLATLLGRPGHRSELEDAGTVTAGTARRLACDADVTRVITGPASEPLDVGRRTKVVGTAMRRAVIVRDGGCRFPGCDRPPGWCDAHHVRHWADGGSTSVDNLVLLCRPHHRAIHRGFGVAMVDGMPTFSRPDGTPLRPPWT